MNVKKLASHSLAGEGLGPRVSHSLGFVVVLRPSSFIQPFPYPSYSMILWSN